MHWTEPSKKTAKVIEIGIIQMNDTLFMANQIFTIYFLWDSRKNYNPFQTYDGTKLHVSTLDTFTVTTNHGEISRWENNPLFTFSCFLWLNLLNSLRFFRDLERSCFFSIRYYFFIISYHFVGFRYHWSRICFSLFVNLLCCLQLSALYFFEFCLSSSLSTFLCLNLDPLFSSVPLKHA